MADVRQLSGPEMAAMMKPGTCVKRGADWEWKDQDGRGLGTVTEELDEAGWIKVKWDNGLDGCYRMGNDGMYELQLALP